MERDKWGETIRVKIAFEIGQRERRIVGELTGADDFERGVVPPEGSFGAGEWLSKCARSKECDGCKKNVVNHRTAGAVGALGGTGNGGLGGDLTMDRTPQIAARLRPRSGSVSVKPARPSPSERT